MYKKEKGITLVALITTIIILVILAAVTIRTLIGDGFINIAIKAAENYQSAQYKESDEIKSVFDKLKMEDISLTTEKDIGKYVDYKPISSDYIAEARYSGHTNDQIFKGDSNLKWRIWSIENGYINLISDHLVETQLTLKGYQGYNNGVYLLDNICKSNYSNSLYDNITARNLKITDIEKVTNYDYTTFFSSATGLQYGTNTFSFSNTSYPQCWIEHDNKYPTEDLSKSYGPYLQTEELPEDITATIQPYQTAWQHVYNSSNNEFTNSKYYELLFAFYNSSELSHYFLSSREVTVLDDHARFGFSCIGISNEDTRIGILSVFSTPRKVVNESLCSYLRPFVSIPLSACIITKTDDENVYHIEPNNI